MNKQEITESLKSYLTSEGYQPEGTSTGNVRFKKEGGTYLILVEDDEFYLRLAYPNFWEVTSPEQQLAAAAACNVTMQTTKVVKFISTSQGKVWALAECFLPSHDALKMIFPRALSVLQFGVAEVVKQLEASVSEPAQAATPIEPEPAESPTP
jgi:hypothetical protein